MKALHSITPGYRDLVWIGDGHPCPNCEGTRPGAHHTCAEKIFATTPNQWTLWCECPVCPADPHHYGVSPTTVTEGLRDGIYVTRCKYCDAGDHPTP